ncbi:MAG: hypothetical protein K2L99_00630, partial [Muribaculaceae bacterium]|nr:hypothetical protein [Muribaculaceae bacterium]
KSFNAASNKLSIRTMPLPSFFPAACDYTYVPQQQYAIIDKAPGINLTSQYRVIDGEATEFVWKKADGTVIEPGTDLTCDKGATRFLNSGLGSVYCVMSHPAFPALSGDNAFRTTETLVVAAPTKVIASFTCTEGTDNAGVIFRAKQPTAVYVDWRGDGTDFVQYEVASDTPSFYEGQTAYAGADAKIYTYGEADEITALDIYDVKMSSADFSPLPGLSTMASENAGLDEG